MDIAGPSCDNAPAVATSPLCDNAPTAVAQADNVEHPVTEESELRSSKRISPLQVPGWIFDATTGEDEIRRITPEDQMQDPQIRFIHESYTASKEDQETWSRQRMRIAREHALTFILDLNGLVHRLTKYRSRVLVLRQRCFALDHACHRLLESGGHR
eukprot:5930044-Pleurochrysis_carterae.AAC.1